MRQLSPKEKEFIEFIQRESKLSPEDEPIFRRLMLDFKLTKMADTVENELRGFKFFYELFAKMVFNAVKGGLNVGQEELYELLKLPLILYVECVEISTSEFLEKKRSGKDVDPGEIGTKFYQCYLQTLEALYGLARGGSKS